MSMPDQQGIPDRLVVALEGVDPPLGRNDDSADIAILRGVVQPRGAAENVDRVVVAAEQPVRPEAGDLRPRVALHAIGEGDLQSAPDFAVHLDRRDLLRDEAVLRVEERRVQIGPERLADEVDDVDIVPWRLALLPGEGLLRIVSLGDQRAVRALDDDPLRLEDRALVLARKFDGEPLGRWCRR